MRVFPARHHEGWSAEKVLPNISVSMPSELLGALRTRTGKRGVSAYVTAAVRPQPAMDGLAEIVASCEAEHEPLSETEVQAGQRDLFGDAPAPYASGDSAAGREPRPGPWFWTPMRCRSLLLRNDRQMVIRIEAARRVGVPVLVSALTVVEAVFGKTGTTRLR